MSWTKVKVFKTFEEAEVFILKCQPFDYHRINDEYHLIPSKYHNSQTPIISERRFRIVKEAKSSQRAVSRRRRRQTKKVVANVVAESYDYIVRCKAETFLVFGWCFWFSFEKG